MKYRIAIDVAEGIGLKDKCSPPLPTAMEKTELGVYVSFPKFYQVPEHFGNAGVAMYLKEALERCGQECYMVCYTEFDRWADDYAFSDNARDDVIKRQQIIRKAKCDVSVSLHHNRVGATHNFNSTKGIAMFYHSVATKVGDSEAFARAIWNEVSTCVSQTQHGCNASANYGMCNATGMGVKAACIIEHSFMSNLDDCYDKFTSPIMWQIFAEAECKGICKYLGVEYVPNVRTEPTNELFEVQAGAYSVKGNAEKQCKSLALHGISTYIKYSENLYKVIAGTYSIRANAVRQSRYLTDLGFNNFIRRL